MPSSLNRRGSAALLVVLSVMLALTALILGVARSNRNLSRLIRNLANERVDDMKQSLAYEMLGSLVLAKLFRRVAQVGQPTIWQLVGSSSNETFSLTNHDDQSATLSITLCNPEKLEPAKLFEGTTNAEKLPDLPPPGTVKDCELSPPSLVDVPMVPDLEYYVRLKVQTSQRKPGPRRGSPGLLDEFVSSAHAETTTEKSCPDDAKCSEGSLTTDPPIPACSLAIADDTNPSTAKRWDRIASFPHPHSQTKLIGNWSGPIAEFKITNTSYSLTTGSTVEEVVLHKTGSAAQAYVEIYGKGHHKGHFEELAYGRMSNIAPITSGPHTNKWRLRVVGVDNVGETDCFATAQVVPPPELKSPILSVFTDYAVPTFLKTEATFLDSIDTDDQVISGTRSGQSVTSPKLVGVNTAYDFPEQQGSPPNLSPAPILDKNHYALQAIGYGGSSATVESDVGIRALCSSHTNTPASIFFTETTKFKVAVAGPWGTDPDKNASKGTWSFTDWHPAPHHEIVNVTPLTADSLSDENEQVRKGDTVTSGPDGLGYGYNITSSFKVTNWAGDNACLDVTTPVKVTGTPTCQITIDNDPGRIFINQQALTTRLTLFAPSGQPLNPRYVQWDGVDSANGATKPNFSFTTTNTELSTETPGEPGFRTVTTIKTEANVAGYDSTIPFTCDLSRPIQCMLVPFPQEVPGRDGTMLVRWIYWYFLGREWTKEGDMGAINALAFATNEASGMSVIDLMKSIKLSDEFVARGGTEGWIVRAMYSTYLNRWPSCTNWNSNATCESDGWIRYIKDNNANRSEAIKFVAAQILASPEAQSKFTCTDPNVNPNVCGPGNVNNWGHHSNGEIAMFSYLWYLLFNVPAGQQTINDLGAVFVRDLGYDIDGLFDFFRSSEIYNNYGNTKGEENRALYITLLGRIPSLDETLYWVNYRTAAPSLSLYLVAKFIRASDEYSGLSGSNLGGCVLPAPDISTFTCDYLIADASGRFHTSQVAVPWSPYDGVDPDSWNPNPDTPFAPENLAYLAGAGTSWVPFGLFIGANAANTVGPPPNPPNPAFPGVPIRVVASAGMPGKTKVPGNPNADLLFNANGTQFYTHDAGRTFKACAANSVCVMEQTNAYDPVHTAFWAQVGNINSVGCAITDLVFRIHGCFAPETLIRRADHEYVQAQRVRKGTLLWDPVNGSPVEVTEVTAGPEWLDLVEVGLRLELGARKIQVTANHAMLTERGVISAIELLPSDRIRYENRWHAVASLNRVSSEHPVTVWNFALGPDDGKDRFVEANGIVTGDLRMQHRLRETRKKERSKL